jgi:glutamyl-tRNA reductase
MSTDVSIALVGTSHRVADLDARQRLALSSSAAADLARALSAEGEAVVLSTCNRTEIYLAGLVLEPLLAQSRFELARVIRLREDELAPLLTAKRGEEAVLHLFRVAAGLDSLVPGEPQILGQVRDAHAAARALASAGPVLNRLFFGAVGAGKRVRAETALGEQPVSVATAAVELARGFFGDLADRRILLLGAGKMSDVAASDLLARGAQKIFVANRTHERAQALARRFGGAAVPFERLVDELAEADVVVSSTRCPYLVVRLEQVAQALRLRNRERTLLFVDIAVPRDVDPAVRQLPGCALYDMNDLGAAAREQLAGREAGLARAEAIVAEETERFWRRHRSLAAQPALASLRRHAEAIRAAELAGLSSQQRAVAEAVTARIVNKLLHTPTVRLKEAAASGDGIMYARALEHLFALAEDAA